MHKHDRQEARIIRLEHIEPWTVVLEEVQRIIHAFGNRRIRETRVVERCDLANISQKAVNKLRKLLAKIGGTSTADESEMTM